MSQKVTKSIIVTGASGFIGSHFLEMTKDDFYIYAFARRSQKEARVPNHPHIHWIRLDIGEKETVERVINDIARTDTIDFIFHFAGYYDFNNIDMPEYTRTNVDGTRYLLESVRKLQPKRFIFASSLTVTEFVKKNRKINEESPADANFPYADSKAQAEELVKQFSEYFPCTIVRQAAIFSDWCEYGPLYMFITTWLTRCWNCRVLAGKGNSAIPYLHVNDLIRLFLSIAHQTEQLPRLATYIASTEIPISHKELFEIAVRYNYGHPIRPIFIPKWLAYLGVSVRDWFGKLIHKRPFERLWMLKYIDKIMVVDTSYTQRVLSWQPTRRLYIKRRLLFLIENMRSNPCEWRCRNREALLKSVAERPNLKIYRTMTAMREEIIVQIVNHMIQPQSSDMLQSYQRLIGDKLKNRVSLAYGMLEIVIRTGDRMHILQYAHHLAKERFLEGFKASEVTSAIQIVGQYVIQILSTQDELKEIKQRIHDEVMMTVQLTIDEIEGTFDEMGKK